MKKYLLAVLAMAALAVFGTTSAFAQAYGGVYGTGNIVPNITPDNPPTLENPLGMVRYKSSAEMGMTERTERTGTINETGMSAFAQASAPIKEARRPLAEVSVVRQNPSVFLGYPFQTEIGLTERTERFGAMSETGMSAFAQAPAPIHRRVLRHPNK